MELSFTKVRKKIGAATMDNSMEVLKKKMKTVTTI